MSEANIDELDYNIRFPPPSSTVEPVVILLGWAGCQDKYLAKYSSIYDNRCITIQYTAPTDYIFYQPDRIKPQALKILEVLSDLDLESNPILFHVFSDGGGIVYHYLSQEVTHSSWNVIGCIFDSLPARRNPLVGVRALMAASDVNCVLKYFRGFCLAIHLLTTELFRMLFGSRLIENNYCNYMYDERVKWPSLYMYSKTDQVVDYRYVEEVINNRKRSGHDISSVCWENTSHVAHLRKHAEAYVNRCKQFLDVCLNRATAIFTPTA